MPKYIRELTNELMNYLALEHLDPLSKHASEVVLPAPWPYNQRLQEVSFTSEDIPTPSMFTSAGHEFRT